METKKCLLCGSLIVKPVNESVKDWIIRHKFCSRECSNVCKKGQHSSLDTEFKKGQKAINPIKKGEHRSIETEFKKGQIPHNFKGENVGYFSLHNWVKRHKGKPVECKTCGITIKEKRMTWANIDHQYKRNLDDFISLCYSCHKKYDIVRKINGFISYERDYSL